MLRNEILHGPLADELSPLVASGADGAIAAILNRPDAGQIARTTLEADAVMACLDPDDLDALSVGRQRLLDLALSSGTVAQSVWEKCFGVGSATRVALTAAASRAASRAELAGLGEVTAAAVGAAFRADRDEAEVRALASACQLSSAEADALVASAKTPSEAARELIASGKKVPDAQTVVRGDPVDVKVP